MTLALRTPTAHTGSSTTISVPETDGNPQAGDVRYLFTYYNSTVTVTYPGTWTVLTNGQVGTSGSGVGIASRPWTAGVGAETVTISQTAAYCQIAVSVGGVDQARTPQVTTSATATAGTTLTAAGLTPAVLDTLILGWFFQAASSGGTTASLSNPTGMTSGIMANGTVSQSRIGRISSVENTTGAATGNYVSTASASWPWAAGLLAVPGTAAAGSTGATAFLPYLGLGTGVAR